MDVSNSTGEGAGYKVVGGGGMPPGTQGDGTNRVRIDNLLYEVLAEGTLEPFTYVTVKPRKKIHAVVFHRNGKPLSTRVTEDPGAKTAKSVDLLVSLTENGTSSTAKTCVCRKKD